MNYQNPIIPGFYPDPSVCRVGEDYYLVNSSFEYFPGVPIFHSRDLVHWKKIGHCLTRESQLPLHSAKASDGIYAPTIRHHRGHFYMATTNMIAGKGCCNFFVHTEDPAGPWSEPVWIDQGGIDPSLFFDLDGRVYWTGNGTAWSAIRGVYQSEIDPVTGKRLTDTKFIWPGTGGAYPEAPHLFRRGDYYYLTVAEGGTADGHMVTVARSRQPYGPFESCPHNPILTHRSLMNDIQATGHADLFEDHHGQWWAVFLGIRYAESGFHNLGRETFLAPVDWTPEGWPVVNGGQKVTLQMEVNRPMGLSPSPPVSVSTLDHFNESNPGLDWVFLRNPKAENWSLLNRPGWLQLACSPETLSGLESPAFIGQRQTSFNCQVRALLDFNPQGDAEEAGLAVLIDNLHHAELVITLRHGQRVAVLRRRIGSLEAEGAAVIVPDGPLELSLEANRKDYGFFVSTPGQTAQFVGRHELRYLSTEVAGGYTGVVIGLYASAKGQPSSNRAYFDWCEFKQT